MILPIILALAIIFGLIVSMDSVGGGITTTIIIIFLLVVYFVFITPVVSARLADNYLNLTGDIEGENKILENKDEFTITRNV